MFTYINNFGDNVRVILHYDLSGIVPGFILCEEYISGRMVNVHKSCLKLIADKQNESSTAIELHSPS